MSVRVGSAVCWMLGVAWGALAALPLSRTARRQWLRTRVAALRTTRDAPERGDVPRTGWPRLRRLFARLPLGPVARVVASLWARRRSARDDAALATELPVTLDLLGVAVGAGCTPYLAVKETARWAPSTIARRLDEVLRAYALGVAFGDALDEVASRVPRLRPLADALRASEQLGAPVAPALARLAGDERAALRRRAEAKARTVPVRLLFPLVFLVLPAFAMLTVIPALLNGFAHT